MKAFIALLLTVIATQAVADPVVDVARTGVPLDVATVISVTDLSNVCGIVPVKFDYVDSHGQPHTVTYQAWGQGCSGG
ncbi:DUF2790 domain-containing protein [Pseudomonas sp. SDO528_S397]